MNIISFLLFFLWLACGVLVANFVVHITGTTFGKVAHYFGGAFVMLGLAMGILWVDALASPMFSAHVNAYVLMHQFRSSQARPLIQPHPSDSFVTVYRPGVINTTATWHDSHLTIDHRQNIRTSWWWMLSDTKY